MQNSKIYSILQYFDRYEQNKLRKYINSPYFNKHPVLIQLFEIFIEHINAEHEVELDKSLIWNQIKPNEPYNDVNLRKQCSELLKLVESYMAQQVYEKNPLHQATYLIEAVGNFNMEKLYASTMRTARRLSKQQLYKPANYYFYQYEIEKNYYDLENSELKRQKKTNYEAIINNLDHFYLAEKLKWYTSIISRQKVISHEYDLLFIDEIIEHIKRYPYEENPPISIYYQIYLTQKDSDNEKHYYKLKELIENFSYLFPIQEAIDIYSHGINYCILKINQGRNKFINEFLDLNETMLQKNLLVDDELSPWKFQNIVIAALRAGRYEWTENFIHTYKHKLPDSYRDNAVTFNLARLYFYQKKHDEVIALLQTVEYEDIAYNLISKAMLLCTYYETDAFEALYTFAETFRVYLNRKKEITANRRRGYLNLIKFIRKLTNLTGTRKELQNIKEEIEKTALINSKKWLMEKIAELE